MVRGSIQITFRLMALFRLPFTLMIKPQFGYGTISKDESMVLNYRHGIVEHLTCYSLPERGNVMFLNHSIVAHRYFGFWHALVIVLLYIIYFCIFSSMFILSRKSDESAITSSLRSCQPSVHHPQIGESH